MPTDSNLDFIRQMAQDPSATINVLEIFNKPFNTVINSALVNNAYSVTSTIGILVMVVYFLMDLEDLALRRNFTVEWFVRYFSKLIIGVALVSNAEAILNGFNDFTLGILADLPGINKGVINMTPDILAARDAAQRASVLTHNVSFSETIDLSLLIGTAWFFRTLLHFILWLTAVKRAIELGIYYVLAPIMFADVVTAGANGMAKKLKNMLAIYMQLPYILIAVTLGDVLLGATVATKISASSIYLSILIFIAINQTVSHAKDELQTIFAS